MSDEDHMAANAGTTYPPPPPFYKAFTDENIARRSELEEKRKEQTLADVEGDELATLQRELGKPRADWVKEEGRWMCFGEMLSVRPSFLQSGVPPQRLFRTHTHNQRVDRIQDTYSGRYPAPTLYRSD